MDLSGGYLAHRWPFLSLKLSGIISSLFRAKSMGPDHKEGSACITAGLGVLRAEHCASLRVHRHQVTGVHTGVGPPEATMWNRDPMKKVDPTSGCTITSRASDSPSSGLEA